MNTPASVRNHPVHPMLVAFPIALFIFSLVCDIVYYTGFHNTVWKGLAFYTMAGGILGALLAAIPGFIDYVYIREPRVKRIATTHMVLNLTVVALFLFNLGLRYNASPNTDTFAVVLSVIGIAIMAVSGWLGGALVYEHHVGVTTPRDQREIDRRAA